MRRGWLYGICAIIAGCISEGETRDEAVANIREAIELYLEPVEDDYIIQGDAEVLELAI